MVLMTTKEIPYRLNPIGMVSSFCPKTGGIPLFLQIAPCPLF